MATDQVTQGQEQGTPLDVFFEKFGFGLSRLGGKSLQHKGFLGQLYLMQLIPNLLIIVFGSIVMWSASLTITAASFPRHVIGILIGLLAAAFVWSYDYRVFSGKSTLLLIIDIILMLLPSVPGLGYNTMGMTGWVQVPFVRLLFQPSEIAKPITILLMNNGVLGMVRQWQSLFHGHRYSNTTFEGYRKTDYVAVAKAFGADGCRVSSLEELRHALHVSDSVSGP